MIDKTKYKAEFDSDFPPYNPNNIMAAKERDLTYDRQNGFYVDEDGCLIRDKFGQEL